VKNVQKKKKLRKIEINMYENNIIKKQKFPNQWRGNVFRLTCHHLLNLIYFPICGMRPCQDSRVKNNLMHAGCMQCKRDSAPLVFEPVNSEKQWEDDVKIYISLVYNTVASTYS
jgi:hypothetical protein